MLSKSQAFIALEIFFLLLGISFVIAGAAGFFAIERTFLFIALGIIVSIGALLRIIIGLRSLRIEKRGRS